MLRRINVSAALIVLVCFFLPWAQVSCAGARETLNGLDLARHDHPLLWLVPLLMLAVLVVGLVRRRGENFKLLSIVSIGSACIAAYLMNDERVRAQNESGVISAHLTGWFWLAFLSLPAMIIAALAMLLKKRPAP
ncbi:MAG: hypothetical protein ABR607_01580 [Pyrinomonadaceae bacterium]